MNFKKILTMVMSASMLLTATAFTNAEEVDETDVIDIAIEETVAEEATLETEETSESETTEETEIAEETEAIEVTEVDFIEESEEIPVETEADVESDETDTTEARDAPEETEEANPYSYELITDYIWMEIPSVEYALCDVNIHSIADPDGDIVASVSEGDTVNVLAFASDSPWYLVEVNGVRGYVNCMNILPTYNPAIEVCTEAEAEAMWAE